jgi:hypothetical protein
LANILINEWKFRLWGTYAGCLDVLRHPAHADGPLTETCSVLFSLRLTSHYVHTVLKPIFAPVSAARLVYPSRPETPQALFERHGAKEHDSRWPVIHIQFIPSPKNRE